MAAINAVFSMLKAGDHVIVSPERLRGPSALIDGVLKNFGVDFEFVDTTTSAS